MTPAAPAQTDWSLFPRFVLRHAGFAFDRLDKLALQDSAALLEAAARAATTLEATVDDWNRRVFPALLAALRGQAASDIKKAIERVTRCVRRHRWPVHADAMTASQVDGDAGAWLDTYQRDLDRAESATHRFERQFVADFESCRKALSAFSETPGFQEAVSLLGGPSLSTTTAADSSRNSGLRQREQLLFMYTQRFCAKNETNSFFGPVHFGDVTGDAAAMSLPPDWDTKQPLRTAFFSHWAIEEVAAHVSSDTRLADILPVQAVPLRRRAADDTLPAAPQVACVHSLAIAWNIDLATARLRVQERLAAGDWVRGLDVAPSAVHAGDALLQRLDDLVACTDDERAALAHWRAALQTWVDLARRFAQADTPAQKADWRRQLETGFQAMGGGSLQRHAGRMFRTRGLLYEDAVVEAPVALPQAAADTLRDTLAPVLDTALLYTRLCRERLVAEAIAVAQAWFGAAAQLPYDRFIAAWHLQQQRPRAIDPGLAAQVSALTVRIDHFDRLWTQLLDNAEAGQIRHWPGAAFSALCDGLPDEPWAVVSPDVLPFHDTAGELGWVLGEIHHGITMDGWMLSLAPDWKRCKADIDRVVEHEGVQAGAGRTYLPANLVMARQMKTAPQLYPGPVVELSAHARRTTPVAGRLPAHPVAMRDLVLHLGGPAGIELKPAGGGLPLRFYPPAFGYDPTGYAPFELCSLPILRLPRRTSTGTAPRCSHGKLVVARAEWRVDAQVFAGNPSKGPLAASMLALNRWRLAQGMPRHTFLKAASEPKPVYIDWLSPHAIEFLLRLGRRSGPCTISEMLPVPDSSWLQGAQGRYTSECRFMMTRVAR